MPTPTTSPAPATPRTGDDLIPQPTSRHLRIYAFDPGVAARFDALGLGEITVSIPWEPLAPGPVGEYLEVVDADPACGVFYKPIDLDDPRLLAQDGLAPSETNPQFHQQMVYAVAMATIGHFEQALGRVALWSSHRFEENGEFKTQFVRRLRIYPHALPDRNAFYSPNKKALLFGYFPVGLKDAQNTPGTIVFTCLSHDIVAHEVTHALLDGVHPRFHLATNDDVLAFHEAFADLVALFQHFSYPGVLRDQIARSRGNLASDNLLGQLAQQFGQATGRGGALRDALGQIDKTTGQWTLSDPDPRKLEKTREPHARGAILVAAVFGAFLKVYRACTADLYRIASEGTGILRAGEIHPDLSNRLADEAARCAAQVLRMAIRATDYCPPVGITFGDYLRAVVTADFDLDPEDAARYRLAFVESFRQWGIFPKGMTSMSAEALLWPTGAQANESAGIWPGAKDMKELFFGAGTGAGTKARRKRHAQRMELPWDLDSNRMATWKVVQRNAFVLWSWLVEGSGQDLAKAIGIVLADAEAPPTVFRSKGRVAVELHAVRTSRRRSRRGGTVTDLVVEITQRRRGYFDPEVQQARDAPGAAFDQDDIGDFRYRAGCTLLIDPTRMEVRRVIRTAGDIADDNELARWRRFMAGGREPVNAFQGPGDDAGEPFALLHRHEEA